jgi:hypothetical protein
MFRNIKNTMILTQLVTLEDDDHVCKVTKTVEEAKQLIQADFEYFCIQKDDIDTCLRLVKSKHNTRTKRAGITVYTEETETFLNNYLNSRKDSKPKLFRINMNIFYKMLIQISEKAEIKIRPQVLRKWQSTTLGENGCPDRYVDVFQGRAHKTVLAKFYTGKELLRLKSIGDKFSKGLKILN